MRIKTLPIGPLSTNCYIVSNNHKAAVIDPGGNPEAVFAYLRENNLKLFYIINTHLHCDHTIGNAAIAEATDADILIGGADAFLLDTPIGKGGMGMAAIKPFEYKLISAGFMDIIVMEFKILFTPGHSPGSISLYHPGAVFVGDLIFSGSIGRTDLPGGDLNLLMDSVRREIFTLPESTIVYPGHGPSTTVADEKRSNPFFN